MKVVLLLSILYQLVSIQGQTPDTPICNEPSECLKDTITSTGTADFTLTCMGNADEIDQVCKEASVECVAGTPKCTVMCAGKDGCTQATVDASDAEDLTLICGNFDSSCKDMDVICPQGSQAGSCMILCATAQVCEGIEVSDPDGILECGPTPETNCADITVNDAAPDFSDPADPDPDTLTPDTTMSMFDTTMTMFDTTMTMFETTPDPSAVADEATLSVIPCEGVEICKENDELECTPADVDQCDANCDGKDACIQARLNSNGAAVLNLNCDGETPCKELMVTCTAGTDCNANCDGKSGCEQAMFFAADAESFDLDCGAFESSCKSAVVFCPTDGECTIECPNDTEGVSTCEDLVVSGTACNCPCTGAGCAALGDPETATGGETEPVDAETETEPEVDPEDVVITPETPETDVIPGTDAAIVNCVERTVGTEVVEDPCSDLEDALAAACPAGLRTCTFDCGANARCKDTTLVGNGADEVIFTCGGDAGCTEDCPEDACQDSILDCGADGRFGCTANCIGKATCSGDATIDGSEILAGDLVINCGVDGSELLTEDACKGLTVIPPTASGTTCTVNCPVLATPCQDIVFNGCACNGVGCPAADECDQAELAEAIADGEEQPPNCPGAGVVAGTPSPVTQETAGPVATPVPVEAATPVPVEATASDPVTVDCTDTVANPEQCTDIEDVPVSCTPAGAPTCTFDCGADAICKDSILSGNGALSVTFNCGGGGFVDACQESTFGCSTATTCNINCDGKATCSDGVVDASMMPVGGVLTITCGVAGTTDALLERTEDACKELTIGELPAGVTCVINCPSASDKSCGDLEGSGPGEIPATGVSQCTCTGPGCVNLPNAATVAALALGNDEKVIGIEHVHGEENNDNNNIDDDYFSSNGDKKITLSLSENTTIHIWAMMAVFLLCNISLYVCYHNKFKVKSDEITRMEKNYSE